MAPELFLVLVYLAGGFIQGLAGFGSALLIIPLSLFMFDLKVAVPVSILGCSVLNASMCWSLRKQVHRANVLPLLVGSLPGIAVGSVLMVLVPEPFMRVLLGGLLLGYATWGLRGGNVHGLVLGTWAGYVAGFMSGAIGAAFSAGGPPAIIYASLKGWPRDVFRGTLAGFFLASSVLIGFAELAAGVMTREVVLLAPWATVGIYAGGQLGVLVGRKLGETTFRRAVYLLLFAMGVLMVAQVVPALWRMLVA